MAFEPFCRLFYATLVHPDVAKVGGFQSQGAKGEAVVCYCEPLATPDLEASGFPEGEKRWHPIDPNLQFTPGVCLKRVADKQFVQCASGC
jgi:hypothetical protein